MLKEIQQQPTIIKNILDKQFFHINLDKYEKNLKLINNICIIASGSSRNAGNIAKYFLQSILNIPVHVDYASEFAYKDPVISNKTLIIALSQSGETADTLKALKTAKEKKALTIALTNNKNSTIHKIVDFALEVMAGEEKSIAATKSFTAQLLNLYILGLCMSKILNTLSDSNYKTIIDQLYQISEELEKIIDNFSSYDSFAKKLKKYNHIILLGRGPDAGVAEEGALKLKELTYINANSCPTGEFLHGYLAFLDEKIPVISILSPDKTICNLALNNTLLIKEKRNPPLFIIKPESSRFFDNIVSQNVINLPDCDKYVYPFYATVCLQILSYKTAIFLDKDVINPRSLTKVIAHE